MAINTTDQSNKIQNAIRTLSLRENIDAVRDIANKNLLETLTSQLSIIIDQQGTLDQISSLYHGLDYTRTDFLNTEIGNINTEITSVSGRISTEDSRVVAEVNALGIAPNQVASVLRDTRNNDPILASLRIELQERRQEKAELERRKKNYDVIRSTSSASFYTKQTETLGIHTLGSEFNLTGTLPLNTSVANGTGFPAVNLATPFNMGGTAANYTLCNGDGNPLNRTGAGLQVRSVDGQNIVLRGIDNLSPGTANLTPGTAHLSGTNVSLENISGVTFPVELEIMVRGRKTTARGINVDHYKPFKLTITSPEMTQASRQLAYDALNVTDGLDARIASEYGRNRVDRENEAIRAFLITRRNQAEIDTLWNDGSRRNTLLSQIRTSLLGLVPPRPEILSITNYQAGFRESMTDINRVGVPLEALLNSNAFQDYIRSQLASGKIVNEAQNLIQNEVSTNAPIGTAITSAFDAFLSPSVLSEPDRQVAYDNLNTGAFIDNRIGANYSNTRRENFENEVFWDILRAGGNQVEVDAVYNDGGRRNLFIQRLRTAIAGSIPVLLLANLQADFRTEMTRLGRNVPAEALVNATTFSDYLRNNLDQNIIDYLKSRIGDLINGNPILRNQILQQFIQFQTDIVEDQEDLNNPDFAYMLGSIPVNTVPENLPNSRRGRLFRRRSTKNNRTKLFHGRSQSLENQEVPTENGVLKYAINLECLGVNKLVATIKIDGKDEPEVIEASNPTALTQMIMNRPNTKDGEPLNRKARSYMALSALKAMVMVSPQRLHTTIPPHPIDGVVCERLESFIQNGNLVVRGVSVDPITRVRNNPIVFDERRFKSLTDENLFGDGVYNLSQHLVGMMNAVGNEYENTISGLRNASLRTYNTNQFVRGGPIKRLRARMRHGRTNHTFDFKTSVDGAGKNVNISFDQGTFTLTGDFEGRPYELRSRSIGALLRRKIDRKRIFDGIELQIVEAVNEQMVAQLRTNSLIATENFAISDEANDKTGRVYIFDDAGNLSYLEQEDARISAFHGAGSARRIPNHLLPPGRIRCNAEERREFFQNPFLSGRLMRVMERQLALF